MTRPATGFAAALALAFALRIVWPLADPPAGLSWSNGILTDPAAIVHAARTATLTSHWVASRDLLFYPLMNLLTWGFFQLAGPTRLATQWLSALLSTAAVAAFALALGRTHGRSARAAGALFLGTSYWLGMFGRVPLAENLTAALLGFATLAAVSGPRVHLLAAGLAAVAAFFGKAHAIPFAAALFPFIAAREGSLRALRGPALAFGGVAALWAVTILVPHRMEVLDQVRRIPESSLPGSRWLAPLTTVRTSWLFHRMPVVSAAGAFFLLQTFLLPARRRERVTNGSALFPLAFVASWIYSSILPYQAPRYYVPAAYALVAGAVAWAVEVHARRGGDAEGQAARPARRGPGDVALAFLFPFLVALGVLEGLVHAANAWDRWTRVRTTLPSAAANHVLELLYPFGRNALLAATVAAVAGTFVLVRGPFPRLRAGSRTVRAGAVAALAIATLQWGTWATHRSESLEDAKRSLAAIVPGTASLYGAFAPALTLGGPLRAVPAFGPESADRWDRSGASHLVVDSPGADSLVATMAEERPGDPLELAEWELRHLHVGSVRLFARRGAGFPGTPYERAMVSLVEGRFAEAVRFLEEDARTDVPDELELEARARFLQGDPTGARDCLERAVRIRPTTVDLCHLAELAELAGDPSRARECWGAALSLRPWDPDIAAALRRLGP